MPEEDTLYLHPDRPPTPAGTFNFNGCHRSTYPREVPALDLRPMRPPGYTYDGDRHRHSTRRRHVTRHQHPRHHHSSPTSTRPPAFSDGDRATRNSRSPRTPRQEVQDRRDPVEATDPDAGAPWSRTPLPAGNGAGKFAMDSADSGRLSSKFGVGRSLSFVNNSTYTAVREGF